MGFGAPVRGEAPLVADADKAAADAATDARRPSAGGGLPTSLDRLVPHARARKWRHWVLGSGSGSGGGGGGGGLAGGLVPSHMAPTLLALVVAWLALAPWLGNQARSSRAQSLHRAR
jgi:hypothetical protein